MKSPLRYLSLSSLFIASLLLGACTSAGGDDLSDATTTEDVAEDATPTGPLAFEPEVLRLRADRPATAASFRVRARGTAPVEVVDVRVASGQAWFSLVNDGLPWFVTQEGVIVAVAYNGSGNPGDEAVIQFVYKEGDSLAAWSYRVQLTEGPTDPPPPPPTQPGLAVTPDAVRFPAPVNGVSDVSVFVSNPGDRTLRWTSASIEGDGGLQLSEVLDFLPLTLIPDASPVRVDLRCEIGEEGTAQSGSLVLGFRREDGTTGQTRVPLACNSTPPCVDLSVEGGATSVVFAETERTQSSTLRLFVEHCGDEGAEDLILLRHEVQLTTAPADAGTPFSITESAGGFPITLSPGTSRTLTLRFRPARAGLHEGVLRLVTNAEPSVLTLLVRGIATGDDIVDPPEDVREDTSDVRPPQDVADTGGDDTVSPSDDFLFSCRHGSQDPPLAQLRTAPFQTVTCQGRSPSGRYQLNDVNWRVAGPGIPGGAFQRQGSDRVTFLLFDFGTYEIRAIPSTSEGIRGPTFTTTLEAVAEADNVYIALRWTHRNGAFSAPDGVGTGATACGGDLDLHLRPATGRWSQNSTSVSYASRSLNLPGGGLARLTFDMLSGAGPEAIIVTSLPTGEPVHVGVHYYDHKNHGYADAEVTVYDGARGGVAVARYTRQIPEGKNFWEVLSMRRNASGTLAIVPIDEVYGTLCLAPDSAATSCQSPSVVSTGRCN